MTREACSGDGIRTGTDPDRRVTRACWQVCGATRIGPAHRRKGLPNQDSWRMLAGRIGRGAVVCDGLGSVPHAELGSRAACAAVGEALRVRRRHPASTEEQLIRLIHLLWAMRIQPHTPRDCATTCLFALAEPNGTLLLGQLGDGLVLIAGLDGKMTALAPEKDGFANQTTGLGVATRVDEWTFRRLPETGVRCMILATDGVADDLIPTRLDAFERHLAAEVLAHPRPERGRRLARILEHWPTPLHSDDKTIALVWRSDRGGAESPEAP